MSQRNILLPPSSYHTDSLTGPLQHRQSLHSSGSCSNNRTNHMRRGFGMNITSPSPTHPPLQREAGGEAERPTRTDDAAGGIGGGSSRTLVQRSPPGPQASLDGRDTDNDLEVRFVSSDEELEEETTENQHGIRRFFNLTAIPSVLFGRPSSQRHEILRSGRKPLLVQQKFSDKVHVYSVPEHSYYAAANHGREDHIDGECSETVCPTKSADEALPRDFPSPDLHATATARLMEQARYDMPSLESYRIPIYDQACFKYVFSPSLFEPDFEVSQLLSLLVWFVFTHVSLFMTFINVFYNAPSDALLPWVTEVRKFIFTLEFAVVLSLYVILLATLADALYKRNIGVKLAHDIATVVILLATFSVLRVVGFASPSFAMRRILPVFINAVRLLDYLTVFLFLGGWLIACLIAVISVVVKVTQIDFAFTKSITHWNIVEVIQLIGLVANLARVDDSYYKEVSVLLDAIHKHYIQPGTVKEAVQLESECLYSRLLAWLRLPQWMYFTHLEVIYNYHLNWRWRSAGRKEKHSLVSRPSMVSLKEAERHHQYARNVRPSSECTHYKRQRAADRIHYSSSTNPIPVSFSLQLRRFLKYLSFALSVNTVDLRRYLQMTQSPLPYYRWGRESFTTAFLEKDFVVMDMALWRNDPVSAETRKYADKATDQFNIRYVCEDSRNIWDPKYKAHTDAMEQEKMHNIAKHLF